MEEKFYVGINEPVELRKRVLETSRNVLQNLQLYEEICAVRSERTQMQLVLSEEMRKLKNLVLKLRKVLPKVEKAKEKKKPKAIIDLEKDLASVENELGGIR